MSARSDAPVSFPVQWGPLPAGGGDGRSVWTARNERRSFDAGWFVEAASTETPDALENGRSTQESYEAGETATGCNISPRLPAKCLVTIGNERWPRPSPHKRALVLFSK